MDVDYLPLTKAEKASGGAYQPIFRPGSRSEVMQKSLNENKGEKP